EPQATSAAPTARTLLRSLRLRRLLSVLVGSLRLPWLLAPATFAFELEGVLAGRHVGQVDLAGVVRHHPDLGAVAQRDGADGIGHGVARSVLHPEMECGERDPLRDLDHVLAGRLVVDVDVAV